MSSTTTLTMSVTTWSQYGSNSSYGMRPGDVTDLVAREQHLNPRRLRSQLDVIGVEWAATRSPPASNYARIEMASLLLGPIYLFLLRCQESRFKIVVDVFVTNRAKIVPLSSRESAESVLTLP